MHNPEAKKELWKTILLIAPQPFFQERGTPIAVRILAQTLGELGYKIHMLVLHEGEEISIDNVVIHRIRSLPGIKNIKPGLSFKKIICDLFVFLKSIQLMRRYPIDLIHAVEESVFMAILLKKVFGTPFIYDMDSSLSMQILDKFPLLGFSRPVLEFFEKVAVRNSIGVIVVCQALEEVVRSYSASKSLICLEDISLLSNTDKGEESLRETLNVNGLLLMYVGNLEKYQGIYLLLESFKIALDRGCQASLVVIGGSDDDIISCRTRVEKMNMKDRVYFIGPRPVGFLGHYLSQADILISPRIQGNNTPMKIYSYLDSGRAILATRLTTHTQVLSDETACLVEPEPEKMAEGIMSLAGRSDLRLHLAKNARELAVEKYSLSAFRLKLENFYKSIITEDICAP